MVSEKRERIADLRNIKPHLLGLLVAYSCFLATEISAQTHKETLQWDPVSTREDGSAITPSYRLTVQKPTDTNPIVIGDQIKASTFDVNLQVGLTYTFLVYAVDANGTMSAPSNALRII